MDERQKKEYQTVVLGALLHDVGKFMNRSGYVKRKHPLFSADYVSSDDFKKVIDEKWIDLNLLKILVQRHHEYPMMPDELLVQKINNLHERSLAYMVSRADTYSSGERLEEEPAELDYKNVRLMSIFSRVSIGKGEPVHRYYNLQRLSPDAVFPIDQDELTQLSHHYEKLHTEFGNAFKRFKPKDFDSLFNGYLSLFEEYLWCVPSDTRDKYNDISLYDHLSTTSAIAACIYLYHCNNLDEKAITKDNIDKFMLVGGDLSGIQKFIFEIGTSNPKKLSKILRGRSFYISLLAEIASLKILRRFNLPISCRLMNAGGRFVLLAPDTPLVNKELIKLKNEIDNWFYERFLGKLSINLAYGITLSGSDFSSERFSQKNRELSQALELSKKRKFMAIINEVALDNAMSDAFEILQRDEDCEFCKIYPKFKGEKRCQVCLDSEKVGQDIVSKHFLYFFEGEESGNFRAMGYSVSFIKNNDNWVLLEYIGSKDDVENSGYVKRNISNYIPKTKEGDVDFAHEKPKDGSSLCRYCGSPCKLEGGVDENEKIQPREKLVKEFLTFQCMSASTRKVNNGSGVDHLAVIKADVDDLGLIFSYSLGDTFSISRYASLSRMLNYFFTGFLTHEIKENYSKTYTVYAGGDDLLFIVPWEEALLLGSQIGVKFKAYVGENPNITISMGINLMRPTSPVGLATKGAEDYLDKSKKDEKSQLTVFGTTIQWDEFSELEKFKNILNDSINDEDEKVNTSFLYRLIKYHEMYMSVEGQGRVEGLKFHSAMARDVYRNIEKRDKNGIVTNAELVNHLKPLYETGNGFNKALMSNLKIPVFWTLYKNRGGEK